MYSFLPPESAEVIEEAKIRHTDTDETDNLDIPILTARQWTLMQSMKKDQQRLLNEEGVEHLEPLGNDWPKSSPGNGQVVGTGQLVLGKHLHPWGWCWANHNVSARTYMQVNYWKID